MDPSSGVVELGGGCGSLFMVRSSTRSGCGTIGIHPRKTLREPRAGRLRRQGECPIGFAGRVREHLDVNSSMRCAGPRTGFLGLGLYRSPNHRVVAGVAGGLAERLRVDPALVRVAFVLLALCGGAGVLAYAVLWVSVPQAETPVEVLDAGAQRGIAVALVLGGVAIGLRSMGLWVGDPIAWSVALVAIGITVVWLRGDDTERARWSR